MCQLIRVLLVALVFSSSVVYASPLDDAKASGHVVELVNGYVETTSAAPAQTKALAAQINKRRKEAYTKIAKKNGITPEQVGVESYKKRAGN